MTERRLTAEMRKSHRKQVMGVNDPLDYSLLRDIAEDALHDLDLADKEIALMDTLYDKNQEALREQAAELAAAQAQVAAVVVELSRIDSESILPDGDHVDVSTALWAGDLLRRIADISKSYTAEIRSQAKREALEEAQENLKYATDEAEIAGVMQRMVAQSKEAG